MSKKTSIKALLVDDEERLLASFARALEMMGYRAVTCNNGEAALEEMERSLPDVVVTDIVMPGMDGLELIRRIKARWELLPVLVLTGHGAIESAVQAMRAGAFDYVAKPFNVDEVDVVIQRALEHVSLIAENISLKAQVGGPPSGFPGIVGESPEMQRLFRRMEKIAETGSHVLIVGESGTGKELIAKALHYNGALKDAPFVTVDCGALSENILESELFGHARGSFTGAHKDKDGYFQTAEGGSIFLDEIGELNVALQTRLLRFLQEGEFSRVGETKVRKVDARVIAATNRDLEDMVREGAFREDLYYRLNVISLSAPPLRMRVSDLELLIEHFIEKLSKKRQTPLVKFNGAAIEVLRRYSWPGNVRELANVVEEVATFAESSEIGPDQLPERIRRGGPSGAKIVASGDRTVPYSAEIPYRDAKKNLIEAFDQSYLMAIMEDADGNVTRASRISGMDRGSFQRLLRKYDLKF